MTMRTLSNDAFVMMDPAVEILDVEIAEYRLLCHTHFELSMAVPPGEGLLAFLTALMGKPINVGAFRAEFDDQQLLDRMLISLRQYGFLHVTSQTMPSIEELAQLRNLAAQTRKTPLCRCIDLDLDTAISIKQLCAHLEAEETAPELLLRCARLAEHKMTFAQLAHLRQIGAVRLHHTVLQTTDLTCDSEICQSL